jgi:FKBP-type peptidyl-prolyl cis-trans isomerases 1
MKIWLYLCTFAVLVSCTPENGDVITSQNTTLQSYLSSNNFTYENIGSTYHVKKTKGYGYKPTIGDTVVFNYTEYLYNGSTPFMSNVLDTILQNNIDTTFFKPISTTVILGQTNLIGGLRNGLMMLQQGEIGDIYFTSDLGYGTKEVGPVPANSILRFRVQILYVNGVNIQNEKAAISNYISSNSISFSTQQDQGYFFIPIVQHNTLVTALGDTVYAHYSCYKLDGTSISSLSVNNGYSSTFVVGKGLPVQGLDLAFLLMASKDTADVILPSCLAYGNGGLTDIVDPFESLRYTVVLDSIKGR